MRDTKAGLMEWFLSSRDKAVSYTHLREDGTYTWTRVNVMVRDFRPEDGIIDMVCVNYDITELKLSLIHI